MKLHFSPEAVADIIEYEALVRRENARAAEKWTDLVFRKADRVARFPESGRIVPEFDRPDLREAIVGSHRLVYRIRRKTIQVVRVFHSARLLRASEMEEE